MRPVRSITLPFVALLGFAAIVACKETYKNHGLRQFSNVPVEDTDETEPADDDDASTDAAARENGDAGPETYVSDLPFVVVANGFGPVEKDKSNGEADAGDGKPLRLGGVSYPKGLGVHAVSEIHVPLDGQYKAFLADVGVDDEVADAGSIAFRVVADGQELFASGPMTGGTATKQVSVDVTGKKTLELHVGDEGNGKGADHGDWAGARLRR